MRHPSRAFTLVELLVVIVILVLLMTIGFISMQPIIHLAYRVKCASQLSAVATAYTAYVTAQSKIYPPIWSIDEGSVKGYATWYYPQNAYQFNPWGKWWSCGFGPLLWHRMITPEYFVCPVVADNSEDWWHDKPDNKLETWNWYLPNPHPTEMLRVYKEGQARGDSTRATYNIRPYMYPWTPTRLASQGVRAILADNLSTPEMVFERHGEGINVAYMDGTVEWQSDPLLWENDMTTSYVPKHPTMTKIWKLLDSNK